ncbi:hypothetical protein C8Q74DRAFT_1294771 [Fomes fomentarius]|nr:hypothetical protein C8Q74DRAFT_1294771 [Fomes fomentarius]
MHLPRSRQENEATMDVNVDDDAEMDGGWGGGVKKRPTRVQSSRRYHSSPTKQSQLCPLYAGRRVAQPGAVRDTYVSSATLTEIANCGPPPLLRDACRPYLRLLGLNFC